MEFKLEPYQSLGNVPFGASRTECRKHLGEPDDLMLVSNGRLPIDDYTSQGIYLIYDKYDCFASAEISSPSKVFFHDKDLLQITWKDLLAWFRELDPETEETKKEFISWKFGVAVFAPTKNENPLTHIQSITVFKKNFFYVKDGIPDPEDISSFHIHAAFVEGIKKNKIEFESVEQAFRSVFAVNREYGILVWNSIPVQFSYANDLPVMLGNIVQLLGEVTGKKKGVFTTELSCISFSVNLDLQWDTEVIRIKSQWKRVTGEYTAALNNWSEIMILKTEFLSEWKKIMEQCSQSLIISGAKVKSEPDRRIFFLIHELSGGIRSYGKFYQNEGKVIIQSADGRKQVDLTKLRPITRFFISAGIVVAVFLSVWLISRSKDSPYWMLDALFPIVMWTIAISVPITFLLFLYIRSKNRRKQPF